MTGLKLSHLVTALIAVLLGYTSSAAIIFQAIDAVGASPAEATSWMLALGLGTGLSCLILSLRYRMPILTAWSTPGAALLAVGLQGMSLPEATGAFLFCAALLTLTGITGWFERVSHLIPEALGSALLAGILFRFGLEIFASMEEDLPMVAVMCVTYLVARRALPRYAIPLVLVAGCAMAWGTGAFELSGTGGIDWTMARPVFTWPEFTLTGLIGVGLPLYIVTMSSQNVPGVVTLRAAGYRVPVSASISVTGLISLLMAPFGGFAFNLAAITAAICAGPEADEDPTGRYKAAALAGVFYSVVGLMGGAIIGLFLVAPQALIATIAGLALLNTIGSSLTAAMDRPDQREAALVTFMATVSGVGFLGIGAPLWALVFGGATLLVLRWRRPAAI
ncbi:Inner membrane protein YdcO [Pseudooceanicola marinus]|uniref:Inner membrane protein YdcO n=1 Tax=Pseudooceanicola marinus TaxID=396013 RepID=A0A1X6YUA8_9RHOB|nr:benzoate/H(+) symporter BenE family transporter [Pseudooceanicola marinus]PJE26219.1 hypothetical protein CVM50_20335 [Pseudooceanicola marinus]SLN31415.1 Inner membrane protein YdcO [Pseudooceanicola marinus]